LDEDIVARQYIREPAFVHISMEGHSIFYVKFRNKLLKRLPHRTVAIDVQLAVG